MLTFISIILLLLAGASFAWKQIKKSFDAQDAENEKFNELVTDKYDKRPIKNFPAFPFKVKSWVLVVASVVVFMLNGMFFWAEAGTLYSVQYPWGTDRMVTTQGPKVKAWGNTIALSYESSIRDIIPEEYVEDGKVYKKQIPPSELGIYNRLASEWEFSDAIKANIATAVIVGVTFEDEENFLSMADKNRSESKLIYGRVLPNIDAALKNTCKLMDAQEYISGKASDFDRYFKDQLENGMYLVEEYTVIEETPQVIGDTTNVRTVGGEKQRQKKYRIKMDDQGNPLRDKTSESLKQYGLTIKMAKVTSIDWETSFDQRLDLQKDQVAQTQLEKQEAEKEFYRAKKEIAKGEAEKASERARLEKEQIKLTIAAETEAKVAEQNEIVERRRLEVEKYKAQSKKVAADAQYYENQKLVQAGLTPQERKEMEIQKNRDQWDGISKLKLDGVYIMGDQKTSGDGILSSLLGAEVAKNMKSKSN